MVVTEGKDFSLFCGRLILSDWVIEIFAEVAKVKFGGLFLPQLRKTIPFTRYHQKATMCLWSGKWPCWSGWRGWKAVEAHGRRHDGKLVHGTFDDKLCPLHRKEDVRPPPAGFAFVDLLSMQHLNIVFVLRCMLAKGCISVFTG